MRLPTVANNRPTGSTMPTVNQAPRSTENYLNFLDAAKVPLVPPMSLLSRLSENNSKESVATYQNSANNVLAASKKHREDVIKFMR